MGGSKKMRMEVIVNGKALPKEHALQALAQVSRGMRERHEWEEQLRTLRRRPAAQEGHVIRSAMQSVEQRIVRGLWVLELSLPVDGPRSTGRNGLDYMNDKSDVDARYTDAAGGKWEAPPPRPAVPSNREIDAAKEAKSWTEWLDEEDARLLIVAAMTKRGDRERRIHWERVFTRLPQLRTCPLRTLRDRYDRALRNIVAELTLRAVKN